VHRNTPYDLFNTRRDESVASHNQKARIIEESTIDQPVALKKSAQTD
jgi:hypothetical protein